MAAPTEEETRQPAADARPEADAGASRLASRSIRGKLIAAMSLIAGVTLVLMVFVTNLVSSGTLEWQAGETVREVAAHTADLVSQTLVEHVHLEEALVGVEAVVAEVEAANAAYAEPPGVEGLQRRQDEALGLPENDVLAHFASSPAATELIRFQGRFKRHVQIVVTDRYGFEVAGTGQTIAYFFGEMPWWKATFSGGEGGIFVGPLLGPDTLILGVPVRDASGRAIGAMGSLFTPSSEMLDILGDAQLGETGIARIYDEDGTAILDPHPPAGVSRLSDTLIEAGVLKPGAPGWLRAKDAAGTDAIHGYAQPRRTPDLGWTILVSQPAKEALAAGRTVILIQVVMALMVGLLAFIGSFFLSHLLTR